MVIRRKTTQVKKSNKTQQSVPCLIKCCFRPFDPQLSPFATIFHLTFIFGLKKQFNKKHTYLFIISQKNLNFKKKTKKLKGSDTLFYNLILENETGQQIDLSKTANRFMFSKIEGLNPPAGTISPCSYAGMDGPYLNNAFIEKRNVVISFEMRGFDVELRRHELYKAVKPSRYIKIYYSTKNISVYAEGIVETCEMENFEVLTKGQISIICPDIYCLHYRL